jgi:hypothetical protein
MGFSIRENRLNKRGNTLYIVIAVIIVVLSGAVCHQIAKKRGAKPVFWGVMGVIFGPLAIPFVFLAKPKARQNTV